MRHGKLDRLVMIQRKTTTQSASGAVIETWNRIGGTFAAAFAPLLGDERFAAPQWAAKQQVEFTVRWSELTASITPLDRLVYPLPADASPQVIPEATVYDIAAAHEIGRRRGIRIIAIRRADA